MLSQRRKFCSGNKKKQISQQPTLDKYHLLYYIKSDWEANPIEPIKNQGVKMLNIKQAKDKLKKIVAGATIMTGIAMGTSCEDSQQIRPVPSEDIVNDDENNINDENGNKNDENNPIENNDDDRPIDNNDNDGPIEHNDSDDPIENNDEDDITDVNDDDPIENNDNDNNPSEYDDSDNIKDSNRFFQDDCVAKTESLENLTQDQIDAKKEKWHEVPKKKCPYNYIRQPEIYDETTGCVYVVDKCEGNLEEPMWFENAAPKVIFDMYGVPPPKNHTIVSMTFNYSSDGGQSNMKIRVPYLVMDVNFVSQSCLSQVDEDTSVINMTPTSYVDRGCRIDGKNKTPPIETKSIKQTRTVAAEYASLCELMPNHQLDKYNNACYVTIDEFVWVENVANRLIANPNPNWWFPYDVAVKSITRDLESGVFSMTMQVGTTIESALNVYITLNNAKSCIDQCYGKEGCTSHIEPSQDASKGCFVNGEEVNGKDSAQHLKMKKHNLQYKHAPRFITPAPAFAKQNYVKTIRPNRQKWLAQNVRNFGRNGR